MEVFVYNVLWLRQHYGLSKKRMAEMLEISYWMLNKLEHGILPPNLKIDILFRIYTVFGIPMADILSVRLGTDASKKLQAKLKISLP